jgi:multiple sugar transport system permease protein
MPDHSLTANRYPEHAARPMTTSRRLTWRSARFQEALMAFLFIAPLFALFFTFSFYPILRAFYLSFTNFVYLHPEDTAFIGLGNYIEALGDPLVRLSFSNTLYYTILHMPFSVIYPLFLALLLDRVGKGKSFFRTSLYVPSILAGSVMAVVWQTLYDPTFGPFTRILADGFGLKPPNWLNDTRWAMPSLAFMGIATPGFNMLLFLVALGGISREVYEAARVDGAGEWQLFWNVTLPLLRPLMMVVMVLAIIGNLNVFAPMEVMTGGGPAQSTLSYVQYTYRVGLTYGLLRMGYAAALSYLLAIVIGTLSFVNIRWLRPQV